VDQVPDLTWLVRLLALTDPTSPRDDVSLDDDVRSHSLAVLDPAGAVIGGAVNHTLPVPGREAAMRTGDPFLDAVLTYADPIFTFVGRQDDEAIRALTARYPAFADALTAAACSTCSAWLERRGADAWRDGRTHVTMVGWHAHRGQSTARWNRRSAISSPLAPRRPRSAPPRPHGGWRPSRAPARTPTGGR